MASKECVGALDDTRTKISLTQEGKSRISGDKRVRFGKGLLINRVSYRKTSDATTGKKCMAPWTKKNMTCISSI